ncbi:MAG: hypothetical protein MSH13_05825 [Ruminococcus callidus]|nr:hypothetical protein [Ruminococcus callidus]
MLSWQAAGLTEGFFPRHSSQPVSQGVTLLFFFTEKKKKKQKKKRVRVSPVLQDSSITRRLHKKLSFIDSYQQKFPGGAYRRLLPP